MVINKPLQVHSHINYYKAPEGTLINCLESCGAVFLGPEKFQTAVVLGSRRTGTFHISV